MRDEYGSGAPVGEQGVEKTEKRKSITLAEILAAVGNREDLTAEERQALLALCPKILETAHELAEPQLKDVKEEPMPALVEQHPAVVEEVAPTQPIKEGDREKWRAELKDLFENFKLEDVLEELDKDPSLAQAQQSFHFDDDYASYKFDIQMKIKQAKACVQECKNANTIEVGASLNLLETLDPLNKLVCLPK